MKRVGLFSKKQVVDRHHIEVHNPRLKPVGVKDVPRKTPIEGKTPVKLNGSRTFLFKKKKKFNIQPMHPYGIEPTLSPFLTFF